MSTTATPPITRADADLFFRLVHEARTVAEAERIAALRDEYIELAAAGWNVIDSWESGDLAGAVNALESAVDESARSVRDRLARLATRQTEPEIAVRVRAMADAVAGIRSATRECVRLWETGRLSDAVNYLWDCLPDRDEAA
jgi:hypothetical protein